jgi:flagellar motility protein MotE (MotC chaperone)
MIRTFQAPWFAALMGGILYLATTFFVLSPSKFAAFRPPSAEELSADNDPSWKFHNPEFNEWVSQIKEEKESLAMKEQQLNELQVRLNAERDEVMAVTQTVYQLQTQFDQNVIRFSAQQMDNAKRQSKVVGDMSPDGAAKMMDAMPDTDVLRILYALKNDQSAAILDAMSQSGPEQAARAAKLTVELRQVLPPATNSTVASAAP